MKSKYLIAVIVFVFGSLAQSVFAQGASHSLTRENISLDMPEGWLATKLGKKFGNYGIRIQKQGDVAFVEINCIRRSVEPVSRITTLASERSNKPSFEYMQIDEVSDARLGKLKAKHLLFTNTYLTESYRGGVYGLVDNGYTYTIEYYGADTPEQRAEIDRVIRSIKIDKPLAEDNMVKKAEDFVPKDWNVVEEEEVQTEETSAAQPQEKAEVKKEKRKLSKEEKKLEKEKAKRLKEETKKVEAKKKELEKKKKKQEKELKKQQKEKLKAQKEAEKRRKKAMKAKKDDSEIKEALKKEAQKDN